MKDSLVKEYRLLLKEFVKICQGLVRYGKSYMAVILCHELSRFLYPVEPYLSFRHSRPVPFMRNKIRQLLNLAKSIETAVSGYPAATFLHGTENGLLEKRTSNLYSQLWQGFNQKNLWDDSLKLLKRKIPQNVIWQDVKNKRVLDMGCGSGRYSIALARVGAREVTAVDWQRKSFFQSEKLSRKWRLRIRFREANFLNLPFKRNSFDFVFCNGVLHHSRSIEKGLKELKRVLKPDGKAFLYLYGAGGIFWETRKALRPIFKKIPLHYTQKVLQLMGVPPKRFIFCDTWYVPREVHTSRKKVEGLLRKLRFSFTKVVSRDCFDLNKTFLTGIKAAHQMWGDGENRYLLQKDRK